MFCKKCGNQVENTMKFCNHCGEKLVGEMEKPMRTMPNPAPKNNNFIILVPILAVIVIMVLGVGGFFGYRYYQAGKIKEWEVVFDDSVTKYRHLAPSISQEDEYKDYHDHFEDAVEDKDVATVERYCKKMQDLVRTIEEENDRYYNQKLSDLKKRKIPKTSKENKSFLEDCLDKLAQYTGKKDFKQAEEIVVAFEGKIGEIELENLFSETTTNASQPTVITNATNATNTTNTVNTANSNDRKYYNGYCIFPNSSSVYLTEYDLYWLSSEQLRIARNEIFARHGRKFESEDLKKYFYQEGNGYEGFNKFDYEDLNAIEKANVDLIKSFE